MIATERSPFFVTTSEQSVLAMRFRWRRCRIEYVSLLKLKEHWFLTIVVDQRSPISAMAPEADDP